MNNNCHHQSSKWTGKCIECGSWNTVTEQLLNTKKNNIINSVKKPQLLENIGGYKNERIFIKDQEFNSSRNGLVNGSVILLGGEPGIGKSTLSLKIALTMKKFFIFQVKKVMSK